MKKITDKKEKSLKEIMTSF